MRDCTCYSFVLFFFVCVIFDIKDDCLSSYCQEFFVFSLYLYFELVFLCFKYDTIKFKCVKIKLLLVKHIKLSEEFIKILLGMHSYYLYNLKTFKKTC